MMTLIKPYKNIDFTTFALHGDKSPAWELRERYLRTKMFPTASIKDMKTENAILTIPVSSK